METNRTHSCPVLKSSSLLFGLGLLIQRNVGQGEVEGEGFPLDQPGRGLMALKPPAFKKHGGNINSPVLIADQRHP